MTPYGLGLLPSPLDARDYQIAAVLGTAPASLPARFVTPDPGPVLDQGKTPQCVSFASCGAKRHEDRAKLPAWTPYDEDAFYHRLKELDGDPTGEGTNFRTALQTALKEGIPTTDARRLTIAAYYSVPVDYGAIKQVVSELGEVLVAIAWPTSWFSPFRNGVLPAPDSVAGGHAVRVIGWDDRRMGHGPSAGNLIVRNSWGLSWGMKGSFYLPEAYLGQVGEAWRFTE